MAKSFGRDELNALLGTSGGGDRGGEEEMAAFRPSAVVNPHRSSRGDSRGVLAGDRDVDLSRLTAAETAALLMEKGAATAAAGGGGARHHSSARYRTKKVLAHHRLAEELAKEMPVEAEADTKPKPGRDHIRGDEAKPDDGAFSSDDGSERDFVRRARKPAEAAIVIRRREARGGDPDKDRRRRRPYDSSSSSSGDADNSDASKGRRTRRRSRAREDPSSSSSSSSDEEDDRRNRRIMAARRARQEPELVVPIYRPEDANSKVKNGDVAVTTSLPKGSLDASHQPKEGADESRQTKMAMKAKPTSSSEDGSDSGDSSSEDGSFESTSSSSEDERAVLTKAVFVPKHKRRLVQPEESKWAEEESRTKREKEREQSRMMESRALVAKQLAVAESSVVEDDVDEETGGAMNSPPNDDDDVDRERERDAWELRELGRLLKAMEELNERQSREDEYNRRRKMTDAECLEEDKTAGRYQAPGANRQPGGQSTKGGFMQRFYHRGAYYMDDSEWAEGDIRQKAAEYAKAATGEDKFDKSKLPEVMQVKKFGHARQNTRYKGLAKEDTTDKSAHVLPLAHGRKNTTK